MSNQLLLAVLLLSPLAAAQSIAGNVVTPGSVRAQYGAQQQTATLAAGPLAAFGSAQAGVGTWGNKALTQASWSLSSSNELLQFTLQQMCWIEGTAAANASFAPGDLLLSVTAPTAMTVDLELENVMQLAAGMNAWQVTAR